MMRRAVVLTAAVIVHAAMASGASAQATDERSRSLHQAARNALGILEYCQDRGMGAANAVAAQRELVARLPPIADAAIGDREEAAGRQGYLAFDTRQAAFEGSAMAQGITLRIACQFRSASALGGG